MKGLRALCLPLLLSFTVAVAICNDTREFDSLMDVYDATAGRSWDIPAAAQWGNPRVPLDQWAGVSCTGDHVTGLEFSRFGLQGFIPPLDGLTRLDSLTIDTETQLEGLAEGFFAAVPTLTAVTISLTQLGALPTLSPLEPAEYSLNGDAAAVALARQLEELRAYACTALTAASCPNTVLPCASRDRSAVPLSVQRAFWRTRWWHRRSTRH